MTLEALCACSFNDQLRVVRGDRREDDACACALGIVDVGNEVCVALGQVLGSDRAAERLERLGEVVHKPLVIVRAEHRQRISGGNAEFLIGVVRKNRALERIEEADAVVDAAVRSHLRVGAGHADCRNAGFLEDRAACHRDARTIRAEDDGHAAVHQLRCCRRTVLSSRAVVNDLKLHVIGLTADFHGGLDVIGVLHAENFLLAARAVVAGLRLKDADLDDLVAGRRSFFGRTFLGGRCCFLGSGGRGSFFLLVGGRCGCALAGAACKDAEYHQNAKQ